ncbi:hypothetical protein BI049_gp213 [Salmonella phage vB_SnwM_CGG4-1]|uniref:Uncharacterized protein n=1 Tax=Salmonella phage vB_SnwM_CGG4-1 TaxID=1815631 RepID=A0A1B0VVB8_9CAUD|nr:hypothetical protein BI049_gp213 [Salmonella phage vB_SnwM_CGG4-1]ANA49520.1 hypothetical protein CGG41_165 [Salmonella phage vB_SnwM_CGG4-1]
MNNKIKAHFLHENGMSFIEIAKMLGGSAQELAKDWVVVEVAKEKSKSKEKVVYRKRLSNIDVNIRHKKLVNKMRGIV